MYRQMTIEDIPSVAEIERVCFDIPWSEQALRDALTYDFSRYYVAVEGDRVIGYLGLYVTIDSGDFNNIAILPDYRRRGYARGLIEYAIEDLRDIVDILTLDVRVTNSGAIALYESMGFVSRGVRPHYYQDGEDAIIFEKSLRRR